MNNDYEKFANHEWEIESAFERNALEEFRKQQKASKIKYCREVLNRLTCENCEVSCDYHYRILK